MENNKGTGGAENGFGFVKKPSIETPDSGNRPVEDTPSKETTVELVKNKEKLQYRIRLTKILIESM